MRFVSSRYSVPHERVLKTLTPEADSRRVRIMDRVEVIAELRRCWDEHQMVGNLDHFSTLERYLMVFCTT